MTFRHLATVVEMADWSLPAELDAAGVDGGVCVTVAVVKGCRGLEESGDGTMRGWSIKGRTA